MPAVVELFFFNKISFAVASKELFKSRNRKKAEVSEMKQTGIEIADFCFTFTSSFSYRSVFIILIRVPFEMCIKL